MNAKVTPARSRPSVWRLREWVEYRLPALTGLKAREVLPVVLGRKRIYIVPSAFGLGFSVMLVVMLLGALNYGNNAALLLTCLLGGASAGSMLATFRVLDALQLDGVRAGTAIAGEPIEVHLQFSAARRSRTAVRLDCTGQRHTFDVPADNGNELRVDFPTARRGWLDLPRMRIYSTWPFGMFRAWSWINPDHPVLVFPHAEASGPPPPGEDQGNTLQRPHQGDDLAALREYRSGDPMKLVAWKASARHRDLLVRDFEQPTRQQAWRLSWQAVQAMEQEAAIERMTRWVCEARVAGVLWTLDLPSGTLGPAGGNDHWQRCLTALALMP